MQRINRSWPVVLFAALITKTVWAQEFTSARFGYHGLAVTNTLGVPLERAPGGYDVSLTCQVIVEADGSTTSPHCLVDERYRSFHDETIRAVSGAVMEPATIDGEPVRVLMNFMVGYRCLETCSILLLSNHARYVQDYGFFYSAPQPILDEDLWYEGFDEKQAWASSGHQAEEVGGIRFMVETRVDTSGESQRRRVTQRSSGYWNKAARAARTLDRVRYIPAFFENQPIEMTLQEYWLDPNNEPLETINIPVRVHVLSSVFVESIDTTYTDSEIRQIFAGANAHWRQAGIQWEIESIVRTEANRELGYRRLIETDDALDFSNPGFPEAFRILATLCPAEHQLEGGWNVCFVREFPWAATFLEQGLVIMGEVDFVDQQVQAFALARELGESLGLRDTPMCTAKFLGGIASSDDTREGTCVTSHMGENAIRAARTQALKGELFCPRKRKRASAYDWLCGRLPSLGPGRQ